MDVGRRLDDGCKGVGTKLHVCTILLLPYFLKEFLDVGRHGLSEFRDGMAEDGIIGREKRAPRRRGVA
jgi:hypothetical protein